MSSRSGYAAVAFVVSGVLTAACGGGPRAQLPVAAPPPAPRIVSPPTAAVPAADPVDVVIAGSDALVASAERHLALGHLSEARAEFDRAVEMLLRWPGGARSEPRVQAQLDLLLGRISGEEAAAVAAGDGFAGMADEPASIDELLAAAPADPVAPGADVTRAVAAELASSAFDLPVSTHPAVLAYVELFQGKLRDWFAASLQRGTRLQPMIESVLRAEGLPLDLVYVALVESAFKPGAVSRAKARGVWQFMRTTAKENGLRHDWFVDERSDPEKATQAAARYLKTLRDTFGGDWLLALASYNGGPGRVQRAVQRSGTSDFWELAESTKYLPRETRQYVPMILAATIVAKNPAQYGFSVQPEPPLGYDRVTVPRALDLRRVAEWTGASAEDIRALNPELRRWVTPAGTEYELKVPLGSGAELRRRLDAAAPSDFAALKWHTVKRGETLATVARRYGVARADLADANGLSARAKVRTGQDLLIPRGQPALPATPGGPALGLTAQRAAPRPDDVTTADGGRVVYQVRRGDTLYSIARAFQTTVASLKVWNQLRGNRIVPGDRLTILTAQPAAPSMPE